MPPDNTNRSTTISGSAAGNIPRPRKPLVRRMKEAIVNFLRRIVGVKTPIVGFQLAPADAETRADARRRLADAVDGLSSGAEGRQVSALAALETLLADDYQVFHDELHRVLCAHLVVDHSGNVTRQLTHVFEKSLRSQLERAAAGGKRVELRFSRCRLRRIDLSGLDLSEADFTFAILEQAQLRETKLWRATGQHVVVGKALMNGANLEEAVFDNAEANGAKFHETRLVSVKFRDATLTGAEFYGAAMQGALLDRSNLEGATFDAANLSDAYFRGASFSESTLKSIARNRTWREAHFDDDVYERLSTLSAW